MKTYIGHKTKFGNKVLVYQKKKYKVLNPHRDIHWHSHELTWGYMGSGPSQLSLALCVNALGKEIGSDPMVYRQLMEDLISKINADKWYLKEIEIRKWYHQKCQQK